MKEMPERAVEAQIVPFKTPFLSDKQQSPAAQSEFLEQAPHVGFNG